MKHPYRDPPPPPKEPRGMGLLTFLALAFALPFLVVSHRYTYYAGQRAADQAFSAFYATGYWCPGRSVLVRQLPSRTLLQCAEPYLSGEPSVQIEFYYDVVPGSNHGDGIETVHGPWIVQRPLNAPREAWESTRWFSIVPARMETSDPEGSNVVAPGGE